MSSFSAKAAAELAKNQAKNQEKKARREQNKALEKQRRLERDMMESMSLVDEPEEGDDDENEPEVVTDSFGNTTTKAKLEGDKETERLRAEAKARREAKQAKEVAALAAMESCSSSSVQRKSKKKDMTRAEEIALIREKEANGESLSNKEKKLLKKWEEVEHEEAQMKQEFQSGLGSFTLTLRGKSTGEEESLDALSAVDIIVPSFTITAPARVLFNEATLKLSRGKRYGLLGPNGRGKSTLLRFLASRRLPVPEGVDVLLNEQEVQASDLRVIDQVLAADVLRTNLLAEETELNRKIDELSETDSSEEEESLLSGLVSRLQVVGDELDAIGAYGREAKVRRILTGLGFTEKMQEESSRSLSGGWRMRVALAKALFIEPKLLLLDEPTNHLDLDAVLWLEEYLSTQWHGTVLVVSHDADFLDTVCTNILHLDEMKLNAYAGNYDSFVKMKGQIFSSKSKKWDAQQKAIQDFKTKGNTEEKARKKAMEKLGMDQLIEAQPREYRVKFSFKDADDTMPSVSVLDATFSYPPFAHSSTPQPTMFHELRFNIGPSDKIAIVGPNGAGKSTLLRLITGRLEPTSGMVTLHRNLRLGIYDQHFEDLLPLGESPIAFLVREYDIPEVEARKYLGMFGLDGTRHLIRIGELSGGQKARVVFASLALKKPHILVLDEPTNNLDLESVDALITALSVFKGGVVLVSHDTRLITALGCEIWVCEGAHLGEKASTQGGYSAASGVRVEHRGFERYRQDVMKQLNALAARAEEAAERLANRRRSEREARLARGSKKFPSRNEVQPDKAALQKVQETAAQEAASKKAESTKLFFEKRNTSSKKKVGGTSGKK